MAEKETIICPVCENSEYKEVATQGRDYIRTHTSLCTRCGFLYQNPRWTKEEISAFYRRKYDLLYRANIGVSKFSPKQYETYKYGYHPVYQRIKSVPTIPETSVSILDIGAGDGFNLDYLCQKLNADGKFAIEPSLVGQKSLREKKIEIISSDVDTDWDKNYNSVFDIVVLRHVFEHVHSPNEILKKIRSTLKPKGILYIAVPNAYDVGSDWVLRGFFRIVHNYYFSEKSLKNILTKNGFSIKSMKSGDSFHETELYVIAKPGDYVIGKHDADEVERQLSYLRSYINTETKIKYKLLSFITFTNRLFYLAKAKLKQSLFIL